MKIKIIFLPSVIPYIFILYDVNITLNVFLALNQIDRQSSNVDLLNESITNQNKI